jgi:hypothetical protein
MAIYRGIGGAGDSTTDSYLSAITEQALAAEGSAEAAASSAGTASGAAGTATEQAGIATTQAGFALTRAGNALTSETNANLAQVAAETAQGLAETAQGLAEDAQAAAELALDAFDDVYLGSKASDPTLDNDGNPLVSGALYYNTTTNALKVYKGSSWATLTDSDAGGLLAANNLSDLTSAATARTNLGLGTAATTASSDYATAAQGALADTSVQPADIGTAAAEDVGYFATAAQGALADTATQPADLATVATTGSYTDLINQPTLGTAAATASTDYATAAQGALADTALQNTSTIDGGSY